MKSIAEMNPFMIHICKYSTAARTRVWGNYRDPDIVWSKTTKEWPFGRKRYMPLDAGSLIAMEWLITKGNLVDAIMNFSFILRDYAYDNSEPQNYIFESTHNLPVIDTNKRRGIVPERLSVSRRIGIDLRKEYSALYSLRWEIGLTFSILEEIMMAENVWFTRNRDYDTAMGLEAVVYNLMATSNVEAGEKPRKIMKIVIC